MNTLVKRRTKKRFTDQGWSREMADIRQKLERLTLFEDLTPMAERVAACGTDFWKFCKTYFPHYFRSRTQADFHNELVELAQVKETVNVAAEPRGFAKSTIIGFAFSLWNILYERKRFIVICMETDEKAIQQTWRILLELQLNRRIINDFGRIVENVAAQGDFNTLLINDRKATTRVYALGAGMSARGLVNSEVRPDLFICDDMESREVARNPKRVAKLMDLVLSDYLLCMCEEDWTFIVYGTIICVDSMLDQMMNDEERGFNTMKHRAIEIDADGNEYSTWQEVHPLAKLQKLRVNIGITRFSAEKQNEPLEEEGRFRQSWIAHWDKLPEWFNLKKLILQIDPSYSAKGDNKAMTVAGRYMHTNLSPDFGKWRLTDGTILPEGDYTINVELFNRKCSIDEMIVAIYDLRDRWLPEQIICDGTYAQKIIFEREFGRYEAQYGRLNIKFIDLSESKHERIIALEGPIQRRLILFPRPDNKDVKTTIMQFVRYQETGMNDDGPDVIAAADEKLKPRKRKAKLFT